MSTIVCQDFISCFESQLPPTHHLSQITTTTLKLKLPSPIPNDDDYDSNETCYAHPWFTKPLLTAKSLDLCTENLGSETGSDIVATEASDTESSESLNPRHRNPAARVVDFPPPLTTMTGANPLQVSRRKDGDRLILQVAPPSLSNTYLRIERSNGRLRMSYDAPPPTPSADDEEETAEEEMNVEQFHHQRVSRCMGGCGCHGSKQLCCNWKPAALWVATS